MACGAVQAWAPSEENCPPHVGPAGDQALHPRRSGCRCTQIISEWYCRSVLIPDRLLDVSAKPLGGGEGRSCPLVACCFSRFPRLVGFDAYPSFQEFACSKRGARSTGVGKTGMAADGQVLKSSHSVQLWSGIVVVRCGCMATGLQCMGVTTSGELSPALWASLFISAQRQCGSRPENTEVMILR